MTQQWQKREGNAMKFYQHRRLRFEMSYPIWYYKLSMVLALMARGLHACTAHVFFATEFQSLVRVQVRTSLFACIAVNHGNKKFLHVMHLRKFTIRQMSSF